jgi:signal transduction histidine kinase
MTTSHWLVILILLPSSLLGWAIFMRIKFKKVIRDLEDKNRVSSESILKLQKQFQQCNEQNETERQYLEDWAIEKEQRRIANELHDDTVQRMIAVRFRLEQILYYPVHKCVEVQVEGLRKELETIIADLRFLINGFIQPRYELHPLSYLVNELVVKLSAMHHQKISFKVVNPELEVRLTAEEKKELYFLVHETAHNFMKSSMGFELDITMLWKDELIIDIKDNGQGLQRGRGYGLGMASMQERANRIQAELSFLSIFNGLHVQIKLKKPL